MTSRLSLDTVNLAYHSRRIVEDVNWAIPDGQFTAVLGPNACGKSTLLRGIARLMPVETGAVFLDGRDVTHLRTSEFAKQLGFLPQTQVLPEGLKVRDLVARGRFSYQRFLSQWSSGDDEAVRRAMDWAGVAGLEGARVDELSGGQRQRVWLATVLAQDPEIVLLDEPTTFLDLTHQLDVLELLADLPKRGKTVVAVLHDINLAARYASNVVVMSGGAIVAEGTPEEVITEGLMIEVFGVAARICADPETGSPMVIPRRRSA